MMSLAGRRELAAGLIGISLLVSGCSSDEGGAKPSQHQVPFVPTRAKVPSPCRVIDSSLVDELIGTDQGRVEKSIDMSQAVASEECSWDSGMFKDETRKQGTVEAITSVELKRINNAPPYLGAKTAYNAIIASKACKDIALLEGEACWYRGSSPSFSVVVRENYVTVWISATAENSPAADGKHVAATAKRIAENIAKNVR